MHIARMHSRLSYQRLVSSPNIPALKGKPFQLIQTTLWSTFLSEVNLFREFFLKTRWQLCKAQALKSVYSYPIYLFQWLMAVCQEIYSLQNYFTELTKAFYALWFIIWYNILHVLGSKYPQSSLKPWVLHILILSNLPWNCSKITLTL